MEVGGLAALIEYLALMAEDRQKSRTPGVSGKPGDSITSIGPRASEWEVVSCRLATTELPTSRRAFDNTMS